MPLNETTNELESETTSSRPRDEKGHFINFPDLAPTKKVVDNFLSSHTGNYKDQEDLLDIKIGNPLGRIMTLLEDIKKQKAFSFTIKGSLGIAGVVLTLSIFGFFGGNQLLCDKGMQSQIGTIRVLNMKEIYSKPVPVISYLMELVSPPIKQIKSRTILIKKDGQTIYLPFSEKVDFTKYSGGQVIATGSYNSCSQVLVVDNSTGIEINQ
jgi:hypothetical protein